MAISPSQHIVKMDEEAQRQREFGILRSQQRASTPLIVLLREIGFIVSKTGTIHIDFVDDMAVIIKVESATLTPYRLEQLQKKGATEDGR